VLGFGMERPAGEAHATCRLGDPRGRVRREHGRSVHAPPDEGGRLVERLRRDRVRDASNVTGMP
jgi:hypothetical protein